MGSKSLNKNFSKIFMIFSKETYNTLVSNLNFVNSSEDISFSSNLYLSKRYLKDHKNNEYDFKFINSIVNYDSIDFFYSHILDNFFEPIFFTKDSSKKEEISLALRRERETRADHYTEEIVSYHQQSDYFMKKDLIKEDKDIIKVDKITINANLKRRMEFDSTCKIDFTSLKDSLEWIPLLFNNYLEATNVQTSSGNELEFYQQINNDDLTKKNGFWLWVKLPKKMKKNEKSNFTVNYKGDLVRLERTIVYAYDFDYWYPNYSSLKRNQFDVTFTYPKKYHFITAGNEISNKKKGKYRTSHWVTEIPSNFAPFNMGKYKSEKFEHPLIPNLNLHLSQSIDQTKADIANSLSFYQSIYGKNDLDHFTIVENPYVLFGESYPGLVNVYADNELTKAQYNVHLDYDINESDFTQLRAHEAAHQWFGTKLRYPTYHDKWLSEGLAEFSSLWYFDSAQKNRSKYEELLLKGKLALADDMKEYKDLEQEIAPIWYGSRAPQTVLYHKSAWIFHMLRYLMTDLNTLDDSKFKAMLKEYYTVFKDTGATTEDFKTIVEKHLKIDMTWFFDQWIYGVEIPKFDFDYDIEKKDDGKYYAICDIEQKNVNENFKSYLPIEIDFGDNKFYRFRTIVEGNSNHLEIPLPEKAEKINFNVFDGILSF